MSKTEADAAFLAPLCAISGNPRRKRMQFGASVRNLCYPLGPAKGKGSTRNDNRGAYTIRWFQLGKRGSPQDRPHCVCNLAGPWATDGCRSALCHLRSDLGRAFRVRRRGRIRRAQPGGASRLAGSARSRKTSAPIAPGASRRPDPHRRYGPLCRAALPVWRRFSARAARREAPSRRPRPTGRPESASIRSPEPDAPLRNLPARDLHVASEGIGRG